MTDGEGQAAAAMAAMRVTGRVPAPAALGRARTGRWLVSPEEARAAAARQRVHAPGAEGHPLPPGEHTVLLVDGELAMTDAPFMLRNYVPFLLAARGDVLLAGLGLGCLVQGLTRRPPVRSVTVLELHAEVLSLVGPSCRRPGVTLIHADAHGWAPPAGRRFDVAMLDVADDRRTVELLIARHRAWADALWPHPDEVPDELPTPDLARLAALARAAGAP